MDSKLREISEMQNIHYAMQILHDCIGFVFIPDIESEWNEEFCTY